MTLEELKRKVRISWKGFGIHERKGYGIYEIQIVYRGKTLTTITHDSWAYDRIGGNDNWISDKEHHNGYTLKQAYKAMWDKCVRDNFN